MRSHALYAVAAVAVGLAAGRALAIDDACRVPAEYLKTRIRFEQVAEARKASVPVRIVVLGTASSAGAGVSTAAVSYPARLEQWLTRHWGAGTIVIINASQAGRTTAQMADRMLAITRTHHPHLLVWQTGTVDAIRGVDLNDFGDALENGIRIAAEANVDLLLVDSQFGSQASVLRDMLPYLDYLDQIVRGRDVALFHRYAIMKYWTDTGAMNFIDLPKAQQRQAADRVHDCLAQLLAAMIDSASR